MIFCNISIPVDEIFDDKDYLYFELDQQEWWLMRLDEVGRLNIEEDLSDVIRYHEQSVFQVE